MGFRLAGFLKLVYFSHPRFIWTRSRIVLSQAQINFNCCCHPAPKHIQGASSLCLSLPGFQHHLIKLKFDNVLVNMTVFLLRNEPVCAREANLYFALNLKQILTQPTKLNLSLQLNRLSHRGRWLNSEIFQT